MKRVGLGVLLLAWLYGVPFLLIVGLIRRTSSPFMATHAAALAFGATTDTILTVALLLNLAPAAGVLLARLVRDQYWTRHFVWSLVGMVLMYLAVLIAGLEATAPLIGWTPTDQEPAPLITRCVPISGGQGCPGG